jgi:hypothetical protein
MRIPIVVRSARLSNLNPRLRNRCRDCRSMPADKMSPVNVPSMPAFTCQVQVGRTQIAISASVKKATCALITIYCASSRRLDLAHRLDPENDTLLRRKLQRKLCSDVLHPSTDEWLQPKMAPAGSTLLNEPKVEQQCREISTPLRSGDGSASAGFFVKAVSKKEATGYACFPSRRPSENPGKSRRFREVFHQPCLPPAHAPSCPSTPSPTMAIPRARPSHAPPIAVSAEPREGFAAVRMAANAAYARSPAKNPDPYNLELPVSIVPFLPPALVRLFSRSYHRQTQRLNNNAGPRPRRSRTPTHARRRNCASQPASWLVRRALMILNNPGSSCIRLLLLIVKSLFFSFTPGSLMCESICL